ncbi:MAG: hypothetical protein DLM58_18365 [Pseudonocardiales bacterium]|nr:MAG: hypothetical protein DLM58_18365 [Pseudonocardiales bacterium]
MTGQQEASWYDPAIYPEWRTSAPWVMDDMIAAQPANVAWTLSSVANAAGAVASAITEAVDADAPVVVSGTGTAGHAARGVAVALNWGVGDETGGRVEFRESDDQARAPRRGGVLVVVSHGGASSSTLAALNSARDAGARTCLIVAAEGTAAHDLADFVLQLPERDKSYCHTVGYTSPIAAGLAIAAQMRNEQLDPAAVQASLEQALAGRGAIEELGAGLGRIQRFVAAGSLVDEPSARELALDVAEAAWLPASVFGLEDLLHGHMVGHNEESGLAVLLTGGPQLSNGAATAAGLLRAATRIGLRTILIATDEVARLIDEDATSVGRIIVPSSDLPAVVTSLLGTAVAVQHLSMTLVASRGTNPDLLRREDIAYREAVAAGGAKQPSRK